MHKITPPRLPERSKKQPTATLVKLAAAMVMAFGFQTAYAGCTATMSDINFGDVDPLTSVARTRTAQLRLDCTKDAPPERSQYMRICLGIDGGTQRGDKEINPRRLCTEDSCNTHPYLKYNLYTDSGYRDIWSTNKITKNINMTNGFNMFEVDFFFPENSIESKFKIFDVYAKLLEQSNNLKTGTYSANFPTGSTAMGYAVSDTPITSACSINNTTRFPFTVSANIIKNCIVNAPSDIDFGEATPASGNLQGQATFNVSCTKDTPYTIGMKPSNKSLNGAGLMKLRFSLTGDSGTIPYQLRSESGMNGRIWGNTANAATIGNGVGGTGTGFNQPHTVYATVRSADLDAPEGYYTDTVTIQVNY